MYDYQTVKYMFTKLQLNDKYNYIQQRYFHVTLYFYTLLLAFYMFLFRVLFVYTLNLEDR